MDSTEKRLVKFFLWFVVISTSIFALCVCALFFSKFLPRDPVGALSETMPISEPAATSSNELEIVTPSPTNEPNSIEITEPSAVTSIYFFFEDLFTPPCYDQSESFVSDVESIATKWDDANVVASQTSRIDLAGRIENLQEIRREAEEFYVPDCARHPHNLLTEYMDFTIDKYLAFMSTNAPDEVFSSYQEQAQEKFLEFTSEFNKLKERKEPYD